MSTQFQLDWRLFLAARSGDIEAARECLQEGANPDFKEPPNKNTQQHQIRTTLSRSVDYGHCDMVELLLDSGAKLPDDKQQQQKLSSGARCADSPELLLLLFHRGLPASRDDGDWALKNGYDEVYKLVVEQTGEYKIEYDIDELLGKELHTFYNEFSHAVPAHYNIHEHMLLPEERAIRDIWELTCSTGSGFTSLINNEGLDTVERSFAALSATGESLALEAIVELKSTLAEFGFPEDPDLVTKHDSELGEHRSELLDKELERLDSKYFHGDETCSLWSNLDYLEQGRKYAQNCVVKLRQRNK